MSTRWGRLPGQESASAEATSTEPADRGISLVSADTAARSFIEGVPSAPRAEARGSGYEQALNALPDLPSSGWHRWVYRISGGRLRLDASRAEHGGRQAHGREPVERGPGPHHQEASRFWNR